MASKIALIDDHQMVSQGLANLVGAECPDLEVQVFSDPLDFLQSLSDGHGFSLVVTDLVMLKMNGLAFASVIRERAPELPVLLISGVENELPTNTILSSGAIGFVSKKAGHEILCKGIRSALAGKYFINDQALEGSEIRLKTSASGIEDYAQDTDYRHPNLSQRQIEILQLIASGESNKAISGTLNISENTVKSHIKLIFEELKVNKRAACIRQAKIYGII